MKQSPRSVKILLEAVLILALCTLLALAIERENAPQPETQPKS